MSIAGVKFIREELKSLILCVDAYDDKNIKGRLYYRAYDQEKPFDNLMRMIELVEQTLSEADFPNASMQLRSFSKAPAGEPGRNVPLEPKEIQVDNGRLATFTVKILFRQNASWQGTVLWLEQSSERSFRSVLELIHLLDSALVLSDEK